MIALWFLAYIIIAVLLCFVAFDAANGNTTEFMKIAGIFVGVLTSLFAGLLTYLNSRRQESSSRELETLKNILNTELESLKLRLSSENTAFEECLKVMDASYRSLASLQACTFDANRADAAHQEMEASRFYADRLHDACGRAFDQYWERANFIRESAHADANDGSKLEKLWKGNSKTLTEFHQTFLDACASHHKLRL